MAYNNSGYSPHQLPERQGWPPNYAQHPNQMPGKRQNSQQHPVVPSQQPQFQQRGYNVPSPQAFANEQSALEVTQMQQHYQYRTMQRPEVHYAQRVPQYESSPVYFSPASQNYPSPNQTYQGYSPQQQYNQFSHAQNQQLPPMPQRQLSYSQPQQYQMASPQMAQGFVPASPLMAVQSFQSPVQAHLDQQALVRPSPDPHMIRSIQSQSPVNPPQIRRPSVPLPSSVVRQVHSQPTTVQPHVASPRPDNQTRQSVAQPVISNPPGQLASAIKLESPAISHQSNLPSQMPAFRSQSIGTVKKSESAINENIANGQSRASHSRTSLGQASPTQAKIRTSEPFFAPKPPPPAAAKLEPHQVKAVSRDSQLPTSSKLEPNARFRSDPASEQARPIVKSEPKEELSRPVIEIDYALLLIDLAEEYFDAAYGVAQDGRPAQREQDLGVFYKLIATGLGCLEVVLKQWRSALQPAVEASVRLRYASILYAETTNSSEAEEVLSKGISQCDKLRLLNLKYNMHHLLARVTFSTNPKAAIKYVGSVIKDAEVQNHIPWVYAFRFLSASLSLQTRSPQEILQALSQLKIILNTAKSRGDIAVAATASAIEAMVHISRANNAETIEQAQTALATVRSAENNPNMSKIPQLIVLAYFVDLMCSLFKAESDNAYKTMRAMNKTMDELAKHNAWGNGNEILIPIGQQSAKTLPGTSAHGIIVSQQAERTYLKMAWIPKDELYALANMLGASTVMHKGSFLEGCEKLLNNAQAFLKAAETTNSGISESKVHQDLACHLEILKIFASCRKNAWANAKKELNSLKVRMAGMDDAAKVSLPAFIIYLEAIIAQGTGDLTTALVLYNNPMLVPTEETNSATRRPPVINDLAILATLNSIVIVHQPSHPQHHQMKSLMARLDDLDSTCVSGNMRGAYYLVRALQSDASTDPTTNPILNTKNNLREVLQIAKQTENSQFSCISLTFMTDRFFKGQMGDQAHKSASTALNLAQRARSDLWTSVAGALLADCLESRGDSAEARNSRNEALQLAMRLPASMQIAADGAGRI